MQDVTRNSYSLCKRESGSRIIWYVRFWDDESSPIPAGVPPDRPPRPPSVRRRHCKKLRIDKKLAMTAFAVLAPPELIGMVKDEAEKVMYE